MLPKKLQNKLNTRKGERTLRTLPSSVKSEVLVDFSSNDYLGFSKNKAIFSRASEILKEYDLQHNGATGSRLLSGNHKIYQIAENFIAQTHKVEAALIFNSGYDANVGFFSSVPQRGDIILYDELIHASIRDGMQMSLAKTYKFKHNDLEDLEKKLITWSKKLDKDGVIYVVTESVFSMDGDTPQLQKMAEICSANSAKLVIDEAHALGVFGTGLIDKLALGHRVFARLVTYGKAMGCHGSAVLGDTDLKSYLVNFARSFIYTTGLPPHGVATIIAAYEELVNTENKAAHQLAENIRFFDEKIADLDLKSVFIPGKSAIKSVLIPGNKQVKSVENTLKLAGFEVKSILSPTVPEGKERLRFCLHSYNSQAEIVEVLQLLEKSLK
ncbi:aminotransferase class I/II-fold pyridoxal phosphate-dependent enzyme [Flavimarina sp. Hel_I_48]|uniref:aminotransferase class I/II-fold pyridoxal phosphate-dependent enzyme n=1 Tax=Flavimarina sp. Hel_I_48 TaxID=1392488 RepID=UPI0004DF22B9|nr:aminotransferase class I/II-fold pyridoxal phosphate-dependent enzyme [Flavimarina sp. Hel_I_48]